jgi:DNA replication protein DnaC
MKEEIVKEIKAEYRVALTDKQAELDTQYYLELAKSGKATRQTASMPDIKVELERRLRTLSGLNNFETKFSLDAFADAKTKAEYKKLYDLFGKYIAGFPPCKTPNLVLCGAVGTGKTHSAQVIGANLLKNGFSVICTTAFALVERFKNYIFNFESSALDHLFTCDLLIIDDLGTEPKIKNITDEYLLNVINERMASGMPFIITTNLSPTDIEARYDERLTSRILSKQTSVVIEMKSKDLRLN